MHASYWRAAPVGYLWYVDVRKEMSESEPKLHQ